MTNIVKTPSFSENSPNGELDENIGQSKFNDALKNLAEKGVEVKSVAVWGVSAAEVPSGEEAAIETDALNGCHATVVVARAEDGDRVLAMTHFPPEIGAERYRQALDELSEIMQEKGLVPEMAVSVTDERRQPREVEHIDEVFPGIVKNSLRYDSQDAGLVNSTKRGRCLAVLNNKQEDPDLQVVLNRSGK